MAECNTCNDAQHHPEREIAFKGIH
jgi:hypothetical protein